MHFDKTFKIYLFKENARVDFTIKVNNHLAITYWLDVKDFETLLNGWRNGVNMEEGGRHWYMEHKKHGPRPESKATSYVRLSISGNGQRFNYRVKYSEIEMLEKEYFYQKHNKMFWDK